MKTLIKTLLFVLLAVWQVDARAQTRRSYPVTIVAGSGAVRIEIVSGEGVWTKLPGENFGIDSNGAIHVESSGNVMNITKNTVGIRIDFTVAVNADVSDLLLKVTGDGVNSLSISCLGRNISKPDDAGYCHLTLSQ